MSVMEWLGTVLIVGYMVAIPVGWLYVLYHKIKCRKVEKCPNEKCTYRATCKHTARQYHLERRMKYAEMRLAQLEKEREKEHERLQNDGR